MKKAIFVASSLFLGLTTFVSISQAQNDPRNLQKYRVGSCTPQEKKVLCDFTETSISLKPAIQKIASKAIYKGLTYFFNPGGTIFSAAPKPVVVKPSTPLPRAYSTAINPKSLTGQVELEFEFSKEWKKSGADCLGKPTKEFGFRDSLIPDYHATSYRLVDIVDIAYEAIWTVKDANSSTTYDVFAKDVEEFQNNILSYLANACRPVAK